MLYSPCKPTRNLSKEWFHCSRLGRTEATIRYGPANIVNRIQKRNIKFSQAKLENGMHEPWEWHDKCRKRQRNKGKF